MTHCWPTPLWRSAHQSPPVPWQRGRPPRLEGTPTWRAGHVRKDSATQAEEGNTQAQDWEACWEAAVQTHEEEARSGWLEMEWERWLRGEETRSAGGHEPAGRVGRGPDTELGGLLMLGKGLEGAQEKELRRAQGGNLRL